MTWLITAYAATVAVFAALWLRERTWRVALELTRDKMRCEMEEWFRRCRIAEKDRNAFKARALNAEMREARLWGTLTEARRRQAAKGKA